MNLSEVNLDEIDDLSEAEIYIPIYHTSNESGVVIDEDSIREEFESQLKRVLDYFKQ
jgi:predicted aconitase